MKKIQAGNVNIVIIITKGDIGGAQIHVKDVAVALQALGNRVTVLVGEDAEFTEMLGRLNIAYRVLDHLVREIRPLEDIRGYLEMRRVIREIRPDLLALHSSKAGILGRLVAFMEKIPATFTVHGWAFTEGVGAKKQRLYKTLEKLGALFPAHLIAVSRYDRKIALEQKICHEDKITAIQNGMPDIDPALMADPRQEPPKLIMVARFAQQKDHKTLIEALAELRDLPWELNLVGGDGGLQAQTEAAIDAFGLQDKVHILGYRNDIDHLMAQSQIFVLSSHWEGFPLTILEAMRARLPVIASAVGGVSEAVIDHETGYVTQHRDELVNALRSLITDPEKRAQMGARARVNYQRYFTLDIQLEKTFEVYNTLLCDDVSVCANV